MVCFIFRIPLIYFKIASSKEIVTITYQLSFYFIMIYAFCIIRNTLIFKKISNTQSAVS